MQITAQCSTAANNTDPFAVFHIFHVSNLVAIQSRARNHTLTVIDAYGILTELTKVEYLTPTVIQRYSVLLATNLID